MSLQDRDIQENISSEEVKVDERGTLTLLCNATEVPGANVVWRREDSRNITLRSDRPLNRIPSSHMHVHASLGEDATFRCHVE
ncbi:hypothetical protein B566_EDAN014729 [Ephemera danica]|nr:hypothetical protein B566_EDAN014729 [Ephemera danica]